MNSSTAPDPANDSSTVSCANCEACCCRLEVLLMGEDDIPSRFSAEDPWGGSVMVRLDDGWCAALDRDTMKCAIYERRPGVCRDYPMGGSDCLVERSRPGSRPPIGCRKIFSRLAATP